MASHHFHFSLVMDMCTETLSTWEENAQLVASLWLSWANPLRDPIPAAQISNLTKYGNHSSHMTLQHVNNTFLIDTNLFVWSSAQTVSTLVRVIQHLWWCWLARRTCNIQKVMCLSMSSGRSKCGANVREQTPGYGHKRMHACYNGHLNIVQFLFQNNGAEDDVRRQKLLYLY